MAALIRAARLGIDTMQDQAMAEEERLSNLTKEDRANRAQVMEDSQDQRILWQRIEDAVAGLGILIARNPEAADE